MRSLCGRWLKSAGGVESAQYLFASLTSHISGRIDGVAIIQFGFLDLCAVAKAAKVMHSSRMAGGIYRAALHALRQLCTTEGVMYAAGSAPLRAVVGAKKLGRERKAS